MKHSIFSLIAIIMMVAIGGTACAQTPNWLDGRWLGAGEIYDIEENTINKIEAGHTECLGIFTINDNSVIVIDGKESALAVLNDEHALVYKRNPDYKFPKYEEMTLPNKYKWIKGTWTDGENIMTFTEKRVIVKRGGNIVNSGIFYLDLGGFFQVYWDQSSDEEFSFIINGDAIAHEGGDNLVKLPDMNGQSKSAVNRLEGYEWLEANWSGSDVQQVFVKITPQYYQLVGEMWNEDMNLANAEKKEYVIKVVHDQFLGDVKGICDDQDSDYATIYLDEAKKAIYWVYDFDSKVYLTKE